MKYIILANKFEKQKAPNWIRVAFTGEWNGDQKFILDLADLKDIVKNFYDAGREFPIDWEHQSEGNDRAPAAGWIKALEVRGNELWAKVEWMEEGREDIETQSYKYLSPLIIFNKLNNKTGNIMRCYLHSVALTNSPYINELKIAASDKLALCSAGKLGNGKGEELDCSVFDENHKETQQMDKEIQEVLAVFGMSDKPTKDEALAKVLELKNACAPIAEALGEGIQADVDSIKARIAALKDANSKTAEMIAAKDKLIAEKDKTIAELSDSVKRSHAEKLVDLAIAGGKALPAEKEILLADVTLKDKDGKYIMFDRLVDTLEYRSRHNLFLKSAALSNKPKTEQKEINPEVKRISGLSDEDYKNFRPEEK